MHDTNITTFYLVRHGETDWNKKKIIQGQTDTSLNQTGEEQAKKAAEKLQDIKFDLAFSSDLLRAKRTAEIIALEHNLEVKTTKLLRERNFGTLQGEPTDILHSHIQLLKALTHQQRQKYKIDEHFESDEEFTTRMFTFVRETALAYPKKIILVGTHGGVLRHILIRLGELTYEQADQQTFINAGYIKLTSDGVDFFVQEIVGLQQRKIDSAIEL